MRHAFMNGGQMNWPSFIKSSQKSIIMIAVMGAILLTPSTYADEQTSLEKETPFSELICTYKVTDLAKVYGAKTGNFLKKNN